VFCGKEVVWRGGEGHGEWYNALMRRNDKLNKIRTAANFVGKLAAFLYVAAIVLAIVSGIVITIVSMLEKKQKENLKATNEKAETRTIFGGAK